MTRKPQVQLTLAGEDVTLLIDALRFARDEFCDDAGKTWDPDEFDRLDDLVQRLLDIEETFPCPIHGKNATD